jgi:hypothetical protein
MFSSIPIGQKIKHLIPIIPVYFVVLTVTLSVNNCIVFDYDIKYPLTLRMISLLIFNLFSLMTVITHIKAMFTNPGFVPIPFTNEKYIKEVIENYGLYCSKCKNNRPFRSHHCKICKKCVLKMDHHCQWIANCVGYNNQKNFYQFLFYATFGDLIAFILLCYASIFYIDFSISNNVPNGTKIKGVIDLMYYMKRPIIVVFGILCSISMVISIGFLFMKQTRMLMENQTTIERKLYPVWEESIFYVNNEKKAFNSVMGNTYLEYFSLNFYDRYGKYTPLMKELSSLGIDNKEVDIEVKVVQHEKKKRDNKELYHQLDDN